MPGDNKEPVELTGEEFEQHRNLSTDDPELLKWMKEKGIVFDSGTIKVRIDGVMTEMETSKNDFATCITSPEEKDVSGGY